MAIEQETQGGPRSYNEFVLVNGLDPSGHHWPAFSDELQRYRENLAERIGVTTDELHMMGDSVIRAALAAGDDKTEQLSLTV